MQKVLVFLPGKCGKQNAFRLHNFGAVAVEKPNAVEFGKTCTCWGCITVFSGMLVGGSGQSSSFSGSGTSRWMMTCWVRGVGIA